MPVKIAVLMPESPVRASFIPPAVMRGLEEVGEVTYNSAGYETQNIAGLLREADICVTGWGCPVLGGEILAQADRLRMAAHTGGSVAPIVSRELYDRGIVVVSGNELYAQSVAEGCITYMLAALREIPRYNSIVQNGGWRQGGFVNKGLLGRKVGLVGLGAVSRNLIPMLAAFGCRVVVHCEYASDEELERLNTTRAQSLEELFSSCDIVSLHLARTRETYHTVGKKLLGLMPDGALLVNTARGSVVNERELAEILAAGRIHAVLDVFEEEPLPADSPLKGLENVILIPHMAGPTADRREKVTLALIEDMKRFLAGKPLKHAIDMEYAMRMTDDTLKL
ncbi:MAG: hydroxyacid dehydrogenase [Oscillospiraceae bacterium]|nr:hydroxyacid dehydrogenase [Oscillospiraceae bacterium]